MTVGLTVHFDGASEAIVRHRLSLTELGPPLLYLLNAVKRTASNVVKNHVDTHAGGQLTPAAHKIDLAIVGISEGSVAVRMEVAQIAQDDVDEPELRELPRETAAQLLLEIEAATRGMSRSHSVNRFVQSLPQAVTRTIYTADVDGVPFAEVSFDHQHQHADSPAVPPRIVRTFGTIAQLGVEPGAETVVVRGDVRQTFAATDKLVDRALALRGLTVLATGVTSGRGKPRLLRLDPVDAEIGGTPEERLADITTRWKAALERLAR